LTTFEASLVDSCIFRLASDAARCACPLGSSIDDDLLPFLFFLLDADVMVYRCGVATHISPQGQQVCCQQEAVTTS
jgi:hypothetical protein